MNARRSAAITIGGQEYEMLLTTRATKAIAGRYGGLENLGEKLMKAENFEMALERDRVADYPSVQSAHPRSQPKTPGGQKSRS